MFIPKNESINESESEKTLISKICHEIGNPLTLINSTVQLMESKTPKIMEFEHWSQLSQDVKNLTLLFHELSHFNHSNEIHKKPVDLYEVLYDLIEGFGPLALENQIQIEIDDNEIIPSATDYLCDVIKIRQAFTNLLKNAIEAAFPSTTIQVAVALCSQPPFPHDVGKTYLSISIKNFGPVISEEDQVCIFTPFYTKKSNGTGLGLPITANVLHAHDGNISLESNKKHTVFTIYLPS